MQVAGSLSDLPVLPIEAEGRLAEGEAVEMAGDRALERLQLGLGTRLEPEVEALGIGPQGEGPIARPIGAAGVARKRYRAPLLVELDGERVRPVLAELLEVAAGMGCANADRTLEGHRSSQPFDLARRLVEDVGHLVQRLSLHVVAVEAIEQHRAQVLHGPTDGGDVGAPAGGAELRQARKQRLDLFLLRGELGGAGLGDREWLARPLRRRLLDLSHVLQQGQGRVDHAGARHVAAAAQLFDGPDQLVAMTRLVSDQLEQHQAQLARVEHPAAATAAAIVSLGPATVAKVTARPEMMLAAGPGAGEAVPVFMIALVVRKSH